jgi:hypothetical protein
MIRVNPLVHAVQAMLVDPPRDACDRRDKEEISGEQRALNIQGSAEKPCAYDGKKQEDAE